MKFYMLFIGRQKHLSDLPRRMKLSDVLFVLFSPAVKTVSGSPGNGATQPQLINNLNSIATLNNYSLTVSSSYRNIVYLWPLVSAIALCILHIDPNITSLAIHHQQPPTPSSFQPNQKTWSTRNWLSLFYFIQIV